MLALPAVAVFVLFRTEDPVVIWYAERLLVLSAISAHGVLVMTCIALDVLVKRILRAR